MTVARPSRPPADRRPPGRRQGHSGGPHRRGVRHPGDLDRRHLPRQRRERHRARQEGQGHRRRRRLRAGPLTNELVRDRLSQADAADGFLLDGYPRNLDQVARPRRVPRRHGERSTRSSSSSAARGDVERLRCARSSRAAPTTPRRSSATASTSTSARPRRSSRLPRARPPRRGRRPRLARRGHARIVAALAERGIARSAAPEGLRRSIYKTPAELRLMVEPGLITAASLAAVRAAIAPGITTLELERGIRAHPRLGGVSNFQLVPGYRHTMCASVNDEVVHGIPGTRARARRHRVDRLRRGGRRAGTATPRSRSSCSDPGGPSVVAERQRLSRGDRRVPVGGDRRARHGAAPQRDRRSDRGLHRRVADGYGILGTTSATASGADARGAARLQLPRRGSRARGEARTRASRSSRWSSRGATRRSSGRRLDRLDPRRPDASHWEHTVAVHAGGMWVLTAADGGAAGLAPFGVTPAPIQ